jgi:hypothetical protein
MAEAASAVDAQLRPSMVEAEVAVTSAVAVGTPEVAAHPPEAEVTAATVKKTA